MSSNEEHYRNLEEMYHAAPINTTVPCRISISEGYAEVRMTAGEQFHHSAKGLHGSMYFKGLDDAAFFAANSKETGFFVLTAKFEVELLGMVQCESLLFKGFFEKQEGRKIWARSEQYDDQGRLVAKGQGVFVVSKLALDPSVNYGTIAASHQGE